MIKTFSGTIMRRLVAASLLLLSIAVLSCKNPEGEPLGNSPPRTRLSNVPNNDTLAVYLSRGAIPEFSLFWVGDDPDGFVIAYRYWWVTSTGIGGPVTSLTDTTTILNLPTLGGQGLPNMILVRKGASSLYRIYNFLATLTPTDTGIVRAIGDSLETQRPFAVPYKSGIVPGDSIYGGDNLINQSPSNSIFIFGSPADSNKHTFFVGSVDNNDAVDPNPAHVTFWTKLIEAPVFQLFTAVPRNGEFAIRYKTETFTGLRFAYTFLDRNTDDKDYQWSVDDTVSWSAWSNFNEARVDANDFKQFVSDTHRFYVRAKNRFGAVSAIKDTFFTATVPDFDSPGFPGRILIINNNMHTNTPTAWDPDSNMVKAFYREAMDSLGKTEGVDYDFYTTNSQALAGGNYPLPNRKQFGKYSSILFVTEQRIPSVINRLRFLVNTFKQDSLKRYLNAGGKLILIGPQEADNFIASYAIPPYSFSDSVLHVNPFISFSTPFYPYCSRLEFVGVRGDFGYPDVSLDPAKFNPDTLAAAGGVPAMRGIGINFRRGFGENISSFRSQGDPNDPSYFSFYANQPLGIRFLGPDPVAPARRTYSVVYFGFPLYFAQKSQVIATLRKAFDDIREIPRRP